MIEANEFAYKGCKIICMSSTPEHPGHIVKPWREARGWSQKKLGDLAGGVSRQNIANLEAGEVTNPHYLPALAKVMGYASSDDLRQLTQTFLPKANLFATVHSLPQFTNHRLAGESGRDGMAQQTAEDAQEFNPRFVAFARSEGKTPGRKLSELKERRTGTMMPFILWISDKWTEWKKLNGRDSFAHVSTADHAAFDKWLNVEVPL